MPNNCNKVIQVKLGHEESKLSFPAKCIFPETTTEWPGYVTHEAAKHVIQTVGCWVVIIRPDSTGNTDLIGNYAITIPHREVLPPDYTEVRIMTEGPFKDECFFVKEISLCQSHFEPVQWNDEYIVWMLCCLSSCFSQRIYTRWTKRHISRCFQNFLYISQTYTSQFFRKLL